MRRKRRNSHRKKIYIYKFTLIKQYIFYIKIEKKNKITNLYKKIYNFEILLFFYKILRTVYSIHLRVSFELLDLIKCQIARASHTNDDEIPIRLYTIFLVILYLVIVSLNQQDGINLHRRYPARFIRFT